MISTKKVIANVIAKGIATMIPTVIPTNWKSLKNFFI